MEEGFGDGRGDLGIEGGFRDGGRIRDALSHPITPLLSFPRQEKLQRCLEPLERKLEAVSACRAREEKKPSELKAGLRCRGKDAGEVPITPSAHRYLFPIP